MGIGNTNVSAECSAYDKTIFFSSRSAVTSNTQVDLSGFVGNFSHASGISIFYDSEGEHHRDAIITELDPTFEIDSAILDLTLQPFEVIQIKFQIGYEADVTGEFQFTDGNDNVAPMRAAGSYFMMGGHDTIRAGDGSDTIDGGAGDDFIMGGGGAWRHLG